ncbi:DNRLRE domain-containing protein [Sphaerisporangium sp. NPDC004334]
MAAILDNVRADGCGVTVASGIQVRRVTSAWSPSMLQLSAQPATTGTNAVTLARGAGDPSCAEAEMFYSIEDIVQDWAGGATNFGLQLRAANESDVTNWRMYRSSENGDPAKGPKLIGLHPSHQTRRHHSRERRHRCGHCRRPGDARRRRGPDGLAQG